MSAPPNPIKLLTVWLNAATAAWNMGEAPWLYDGDGQCLLVYLWARTLAISDDWVATNTVVCTARERGVDPKRHKWHGKQ